MPEKLYGTKQSDVRNEHARVGSKENERWKSSNEMITSNPYDRSPVRNHARLSTKRPAETRVTTKDERNESRGVASLSTIVASPDDQSVELRDPVNPRKEGKKTSLIVQKITETSTLPTIGEFIKVDTIDWSRNVFFFLYKSVESYHFATSLIEVSLKIYIYI